MAWTANPFYYLLIVDMARALDAIKRALESTFYYLLIVDKHA